MARIPRALAWCVCVLAAAAGSRPAGAVASHATASTSDVRGLWVLRTSLTSPASIRTMVDTARDAGFNTLLVQVRGRGEAFYRSDIDPRATDLDDQPATFDPLQTVLDLAHAAGLRVHAWINVDLVASATTLPRSRDHVIVRHPDWLMVPRELAGTLDAMDPRSPAYVGTLARWTRGAPDQVEGLYLSPVTEQARQYTESVVRELATRYDLDGIHFDYLRYPNQDFDYGAAALAAFRLSMLATTPPAERLELDGLARTAPAAWTGRFPEAWAAFRRDRLNLLFDRLQAAARAARPNLLVSAAVRPDADQARAERLQDWRTWVASGELDAVCAMDYATEPDEFARLLETARQAAGSTPLWLGIGAYRLPAATAALRVRLARQAGLAGVLLFSYDSMIASGADAPGYFAELRPVLLEPPTGSGLRP
jgi:uncharacterized lipoprotein YddW (UPF0748 family)